MADGTARALALATLLVLAGCGAVQVNWPEPLDNVTRTGTTGAAEPTPNPSATGPESTTLLTTPPVTGPASVRTTSPARTTADWPGTTDTSGAPTTVSTREIFRPPPDRGVNATVREVVDGDSLTVEYANGTTERVRFMGIDTPEVHVPTCPREFEGVPDDESGRVWLRHWGDRATNATAAAVEGREVRLVTDPTLPRRGVYGRLLAYVYVDGRLLNYDLVTSGHARLFDVGFVFRGPFLAAERRAREGRVGVWNYSADAPAAQVSEGGLPGRDGQPICPVG